MLFSNYSSAASLLSRPLSVLVALLLFSSSVAAIPNQAAATDPEALLSRIRQKEAAGQSSAAILHELRTEMHANELRYFYLDHYGWVDGRHFFWTATNTSYFGYLNALLIGFLAECYQFLRGQPSGFSPEDLSSNAAGAAFALFQQRSELNLSTALEQWFLQKGGRAKNDPATHFQKLPAQP